MAKDFLLEIGTEEIPARYLPGALEELAAVAEQLLAEVRLLFEDIRTYGTPRRLALRVFGLAARQTPLILEVKGPPCKAAFDAEGRPTRAAEGFARNQGVRVEDLVVRKVGDTDYVFAVKEEPGRATTEMLQELGPRIITSLSFPKFMRWGDYDLKFIRPIRWLVALYGEDVVSFALAGVRADRYTYGHRFLRSGPHALTEPGTYVDTLRAAFVLVNPAERRSEVWRQVQEAAQAAGGTVLPDEELLDEVANLLEYPTAFCGRFPAAYLELPPPVLVTPMREHQRFFPVYGADGKLLPLFIGVHNGTAEHIDTIRAGNEKVLRARLADARFFYEEDLKEPLAAKAEKLKKIVFLEELGSLYDKTERLEALASYLAGVLALDPADAQRAARAARLCKADLVTSMVYEFPELEGVMGREYALRGGEDPLVAQAIYEHYLPRGAGDELPATAAGRVLSLAEKADNLVGCFGLGIVPTGSQDPYALRRHALGMCRLLLEADIFLQTPDLFRRAYGLYGGRLKLGEEEVVSRLGEFVAQRLRGLFVERGLAADVVEAVLAAGAGDVRDAWERGRALAVFRTTPAFEDVHTAFTRAHNLAKNAPDGEVDPALFEDPAESELLNVYREVAARVKPLLAARRYAEALPLMAALRRPVDRFFDAVLVMSEDRALRHNRLSQLRQVAGLVKKVADFSRLVVAT
ncbi:MAG: glycine--tRNA ligase subunit beta [Desulfotomaculales bacterium]